MNSAILYIVATPIGNLMDISQRALQVLKEIDLIAAEDTRHSQLLLNHYGIRKPLLTYHEHNEEQQTERLLEKLRRGENVALISDAGTPLVSDPGFSLVQCATQTGIRVVPIPGASALITALSASGLPSDRFYFAGFLSAKPIAREKQLTALQTLTCTLIFYAAPHRIMMVLDSMIAIWGGQRQAAIGRELTKKFETFYYGDLEVIKQQLVDHNEQQKGEFVILVHGAEQQEIEPSMEQLEQVLTALLSELPLKQAVKLAVKLTGINKNSVYEQALLMKNP